MAEEFTVAPMRRLLKKHGDLRISDGAAEELRRAVGEYGSMVAEAAISIAQKDGRRTVLDRDVIAARASIKGEQEN
ncbi:MAG: NFYB/HAP3 family transcription factor subunit [Candidatus Bathyarchaeota archaeon]